MWCLIAVWNRVNVCFYKVNSLQRKCESVFEKGIWRPSSEAWNWFWETAGVPNCSFHWAGAAVNKQAIYGWFHINVRTQKIQRVIIPLEARLIWTCCINTVIHKPIHCKWSMPRLPQCHQRTQMLHFTQAIRLPCLSQSSKPIHPYTAETD